MKYILHPRLSENLELFPPKIRTKFWRNLKFLLRNLRHPSLRTKKYDESKGIWQARVGKSIRFYFLIQGDAYILLDIKKHPK